MGLSSILSMAYELSLAQVFLPEPLICAHLQARSRSMWDPAFLRVFFRHERFVPQRRLEGHEL